MFYLRRIEVLRVKSHRTTAELTKLVLGDDEKIMHLKLNGFLDMNLGEMLRIYSKYYLNEVDIDWLFGHVESIDEVFELLEISREDCEFDRGIKIPKEDDQVSKEVLEDFADYLGLAPYGFITIPEVPYTN